MKFRWDSKSPKPIDVSVDAVPPPSAGGRLKFMVELMLAIHRYGATSKVQPGAVGCPRLIGCCARAPDIPPVAIMAVRTAAMRIRFSIESSFAPIYRF